ncbi:MAG: hypothetical protein QQN41_00105 [Nitrosopumilus sp.]
MFNDSGLITKGFGRDQRLVTQGYGSSFEVGGPSPTYRKELKEYDLDILAPILRENSEEVEIYSPLEIRRDEEITINSSVSKEMEEDINITTNIDHSKLSEILDAI